MSPQHSHDDALLRRAANALRSGGNTEAADQVDAAADRSEAGDTEPGDVFRDALDRAHKSIPKPGPRNQPDAETSATDTSQDTAAGTDPEQTA